MRIKPSFFVLFLLVAGVCAGLRLWDLDRRPMHTDEAVHAVKFGELLEEGRYRFDPVEFHGPTLNYATLIPAWIRGQRLLAELDETTLRLVPALFGIVLAVLSFWIASGAGRHAGWFAALFTALSPAMVFYSRYYIQEILFVAATAAMIGSGVRFVKAPHVGWAAAAGSAAGFMHATKETCVVQWAAMAAALAGMVFFGGNSGWPRVRLRWIHAAVAAGSAVAVSVLFFSSWFTHPRGVLDSLLTYRTYFGRGGGQSIHVQPWWYYLRLLAWWKASGGPVWSEAFILCLGTVGIAAAWTGDSRPGWDRTLVRFLSLYTVVLAALYSAIPYKTPWNCLGFWHGWILLAGAGASFAMESARLPVLKRALGIWLAAGVVHLCVQSLWSVGRYDCDPANPYVYAHPDRDVLAVSERVHRAAEASVPTKSLFIEVAYPRHQYWPLPWYFRDLPNTAWFDRMDTASFTAPLVLAAPEYESDLVHRLYALPPPGKRTLYVPLFDRDPELRPGAPVAGWIEKALLDRMEE
jgi:uncharacterized protein (TIGR03663 family)